MACISRFPYRFLLLPTFFFHELRFCSSIVSMVRARMHMGLPTYAWGRSDVWVENGFWLLTWGDAYFPASGLVATLVYGLCLLSKKPLVASFVVGFAECFFWHSAKKPLCWVFFLPCVFFGTREKSSLSSVRKKHSAKTWIPVVAFLGGKLVLLCHRGVLTVLMLGLIGLGLFYETKLC